jgi:hypothetical protein
VLLAGGGEFAFIIFKLAGDLGVVSEDATKLLTASVILSMSCTPLLGDLAAYLGDKLEDKVSPVRAPVAMPCLTRDAIVICGLAETGKSIRDGLDGSNNIVTFSRNPECATLDECVVYGDGSSPALLRAAGVEAPRAIVVTYVEEAMCLEATSRMRQEFPGVPIYVRAMQEGEKSALLDAGATEVVVVTDLAAERFIGLLSDLPEDAPPRSLTPA